MRKPLAYLVAVLTSVTPVSCSLAPESGSGLRQDPFCANLLQTKDHVEALDWLQQSKAGDIRTLGEQDPDASLAIVKQLYYAGATRVHAVEIERAPGVGQTSNTLIVELPPDPLKRSDLFAFEARLARGQGFDPVPDEGQRYMFLYGFKLSFWQAVRMIFGRNPTPKR